MSETYKSGVGIELPAGIACQGCKRRDYCVKADCPDEYDLDCPFFVPAKQTRFSLLASSVDEMAAALVHCSCYDDELNPMYKVSGVRGLFSTQEEALAAAKKWLLEVVK